MADGTTAVRLRDALNNTERKHPLLAAGAVNALAAHVAAEAGFDALWVSGLEVSAASGLPDANVVGPRDLSDVVASLSGVHREVAGHGSGVRASFRARAGRRAVSTM
ncbi:isocitrate lyase/phosphoenolpyruvate mutase family protein, partial [Streptomyces sp. NPDC048389]|uniref:isocitrate lyase/phosphoenolpyruvate mutase family protein n=1 Tax=Streptomyces sp. NPDC048389 TaxID=3154622 RepID=UPI003456C7BB